MIALHQINDTHDPARFSWLASANAPGGDFPIQNLPFAVFRTRGSEEPWRCGVAIGDRVLDLSRLARERVFRGSAGEALAAAQGGSLNALAALGPAAWSELRRALAAILLAGADAEAAVRPCLVAQRDVDFRLPVDVGDYTDFYTSIHHATNIGRLFRPDNPLLPNYRWVPIGYHGRASSLAVSGHTFPRPHGQLLPAGAAVPVFGPCKRLDFELELGIVIGPGNRQGCAIDIAAAEQHIFGITLLNDWSARDIQAWEYQPLGPFLSKNFATTLSPWVVTLEALAPYRVPFVRGEGEPAPLPYLDSPTNRSHGAIDLRLAVTLETARMRACGAAAHTLCETSYRHAYWTMAQLVAHHTSGGCNLRPGDLFGSGTLSGPTASEAGAMIELTHGGKTPVWLNPNESRTFLEDGDAVTLRGWCEAEGMARIGFGECRGQVAP
jgi:fumarylacetoacetase